MTTPIKTIGNPASWLLNAFADASHYAKDAAHEIGGDAHAQPTVKQIGIEDIRIALRKGAKDFSALRTDVMFIVILYPIIGLCLAAIAFHRELLPLLFPLMAGFALLGPVAAVGLYEMSRCREKGETADFRAALGVIESPAIGAVLIIGLGLVLMFVVWMLTATLVFTLTLGPELPVSVTSFLRDIFTTGAGWAMLVIGCAAGFVFAAATLAMMIVSIPLLLDRHVGVGVAIATSLELTRKNPMTVTAWGFIVAAFLIVGTIPLFLGLILVFPILGHATWHLYRRSVE
ncbi:Uncharacterized membrane protein [Roseovarius lutimaris]|uniref:Uncharacterized membrane protein n=1 Tax=Roseovarius lutimaris TaxID=1005928 RepID=A0A1I5HAE0_9RHOB|nr:DUF2189 domain-containing protein [Roseovarius lutimaris]SFO44791.1 Uncharacterized membrane protein [Roseovarius lutimaris]